MKNFLYGALAIAFVAATAILLIVLKVDVADITFAMLAGTVIGCVSAFLSITHPLNSGRVPGFVLAIGVAGGAVGWMFGMLCLRMIQVDLYSSTALAFDVLTGLVGSTTFCVSILQRPGKQPTGG